MATVQGTLYLDANTGRTLRRTCCDVLRDQVIYASGSFRAGDSVYVAFRSKDGAQYVIAAAAVCCDVDTSPCEQRAEHTRVAIDDDRQRVIIRERDIRLLWPPSEF